MNAAHILNKVEAAGGPIRLLSPRRLHVEAQQPLPPALEERLLDT